MTTSSPFSGTDNLEIMANAKCYNAYLIGILLKWLPGHKTVIDFGAGSGTLATLLRNRGMSIICVEPDEKLRGQLHELGFEAHPSLDLPPNQNRVNAIYSFNVLEHIADDAGTLRALHDRIQPGGRLILYVPAFQLLFSDMDRHVGHVRRYRKKQLAKLVRAAGFDIERARYADSLGFIATLVYKMLAGSEGRINPKSLLIYDRVIFPLSRLLDYLFWPFFGKNLLIVARK